MNASIISCAVIRPSTTASTCSAIGASTPVRWARSSSDEHDFAPSATWRVEAIDLLGGHALAELLAEGPVARQRRGAGGDQVAEPGQAHQGQRVGAERHRQPGGLGEAAGDHRGRGVVAEAEADGHADGEARRRSCRRRRARSRARRRWCRDGTPASGTTPCSRLATLLVGAGDDGGGRLAAGDLLGQVGAADHGDPLRAGAGDLGDHLAHPLERCRARRPSSGETSTASGGMSGAHSARFSRSVCDGTASTTTSAPRSACSGSWVAATRRRQLDARAGSRGSRAAR